jgi:hypothetical protein
MSTLSTVTVTYRPGSATALFYSPYEPTTVVNTDAANPILLSYQSVINAGNSGNYITLGPGQGYTFNGDNTVYATTATAGITVNVSLAPGGTNFIQPTSLSNIGGITVFIQSTMPVPPPAIPANSLWLQTNAGIVIGFWTRSGTLWVQQQFDASTVIAVGTIIANLIAAGTVFAGIVNGTTITGALFIAETGSAVAPTIQLKTLFASEAGYAAIYNQGTNEGEANEFENMWVQGPSSTYDNNSAAIAFSNTSANGATIAAGQFVYSSAGAVNALIAYWESNGFHFNEPLWGNAGVLTLGDLIARTPTGLSGAPVITQTALVLSAVQATSFSLIGNIWDIPANDAKANTVFRIKGVGQGNWGTGTALDIRIFAWGKSVAQVGLGSATFASAVAFNIDYEATVFVMTAGSAGEVYGHIRGAISIAQPTRAEGGTSTTQQSIGFSQEFVLTDTAVNTSVNSNIAMQAAWSSTSGIPEIQVVYETLERMGP